MPKYNHLDIYRPVQATEPAFFNTCFYCGCVATEFDFCPPLKYASYYIQSREPAEFFQVPACFECSQFLLNEKQALLHERQLIVKKKLAFKYRKALRVYDVWEEDELAELDYSLKKSISAGLSLGQESFERYTFKGFEFEADGEKHTEFYTQRVTYMVLGEKFNSFRDALSYVSKSFRIPKAKLQELYAQNDNSFDKAISAFHIEVEKKLFEKQLKVKSTEFANTHKLNVKFVMRTVQQFIDSDGNLTIDSALSKLASIREARSNS